MVNEVHAEMPLDTEQTPVGRPISRGDSHYPAVLNLQVQLTPDPAVRANGEDLFLFPIPAGPLALLGCEGPYRANADTVTAENARRVFKSRIKSRRDFSLKSTVGVIHGRDHLNFAAHPDTAPAQNTLVVITLEKRVAVINRVLSNFTLETGCPDPVPVSVILQAAVPVLFTG